MQINKPVESNVKISSEFETYYREMVRIRFFEEKLLEEFSSGLLLGTTHTYIGQEANAVGVLREFDLNDIVVSNHRSHGHFLAYGGEMRSLFAEIMGKPSGVCGGRGGSQHLHWKNFYSNGVLGGTAPIATGIALAEKIMQRGTTTIIFLGDGAFGEGVVYESLNMASLWSIPILFVVENNRIAQTTPLELNTAGDFTQRLESFGIPAQRIDSSDVVEIGKLAAQIKSSLQQGLQPQAMIIDTNRFGPHSKGDDTRPEAHIRELKKNRDPILIHGDRINPEKRSIIHQEVRDEVKIAYHQALDDPYYLENN